MDKLQVVDTATVSAVLKGVTDRTIRTWVSELGCPAIKDGRSLRFNWPDVLDWYVDYAAAKKGGVTADFHDEEESPEGNENLGQANLRKTRTDADIKQLQLAKLRGEHISIADAKLKLDRMMNNLRSRLLGLAPKINSRISGIKEPSQREAAIKEEIENVAREISTGAVVDIPAHLVDEDLVPGTVEINASIEPQHSFIDQDFGLA